MAAPDYVPIFFKKPLASRGASLSKQMQSARNNFADAPPQTLGRSASNKSPTLPAAGRRLALVKLRCFAVSEIDSRRSA